MMRECKWTKKERRRSVGVAEKERSGRGLAVAAAPNLRDAASTPNHHQKPPEDTWSLGAFWYGFQYRKRFLMAQKSRESLGEHKKDHSRSELCSFMCAAFLVEEDNFSNEQSILCLCSLIAIKKPARVWTSGCVRIGQGRRCYQHLRRRMWTYFHVQHLGVLYRFRALRTRYGSSCEGSFLFGRPLINLIIDTKKFIERCEGVSRSCTRRYPSREILLK